MTEPKMLQLQWENKIICARLFSAETHSLRVLYVHADEEEAPALWQAVRPTGASLVCVSGEDWNRDLTPWAAEKVFRRGEDFAGKAPAYLRFWQEELLPAVEATLGFVPVFRGIAGYSLAGLFAMYAAECGLFHGAASVSGSLWFDGWLAHFRREPLPAALQKVYLSVGDKEKNARNPRMATVEDCTRAAAEFLQKNGVAVQFELNPGGHFNEPDTRLAKGLLALASP